MDRLLKCKDILNIFGISRSTLYRMERNGSFPMRAVFNKSKALWWASSIEEYQEKLKQNQVPVLSQGKIFQKK